jgi:hypothetical protein
MSAADTRRRERGSSRADRLRLASRAGFLEVARRGTAAVLTGGAGRQAGRSMLEIAYVRNLPSQANAA